MSGASDAAPWIITALSTLAGGGGVWGWLTARQKLKAAAPADLANAYAQFARVLNAQAEAFIEAQRREIEGMRGEIEELKTAHRSEMAASARQHAECLGHNRQLYQIVSSLEEILRRHDISVPIRKLEGSLLVLEGDAATMLRPGSPAGPAGPL